MNERKKAISARVTDAVWERASKRALGLGLALPEYVRYLITRDLEAQAHENSV